MKQGSEPGRKSEPDILHFDVADDALEAAGQPPAGPAFSFANAPTVSILFSCCGSDPAGPAA